MKEAIKNFAKQFEYEPVIKNSEKLGAFRRFVVVGVGGSRLPAVIAKTWKPSLILTIHNDYGLPALPEEELQQSLVIVSSYSGNTEEALDAYASARSKNYPVAVITVGGKLLEMAKRDGVPYIELPNVGIQPRAALGYSFRALLKFLGEVEAMRATGVLAKSLDVSKLEAPGRELADRLRDFIPVIYSSSRNYAIAYNWKIKFNETGKIPAFAGMLPELNHNEMTGFDVEPSTAHLAKPFYFIFLKDSEDGPKMSKRIEVLHKLYDERKLPIEIMELSSEGDVFHKIFSSLVLADWVAYYTALNYGRDPKEVPMVEEFKKLIGDY